MSGIDGKDVGTGTGGADERHGDGSGDGSGSGAGHGDGDGSGDGSGSGAGHGDAQSSVTGRKGLILGTRHIYRGEHHKGLRGWDVVVVGVIRGEELLTREDDIGELHDGDRLEVRPVIEGRLSFVSYDAAVGELQATGALWTGKSTGPLLNLGCDEGEAEDRASTCLEVEAALFHANRIARTELCIETLETRNSDRLDFHEVSAASVKAALLAAFEAGRVCAKEEAS